MTDTQKIYCNSCESETTHCIKSCHQKQSGYRLSIDCDFVETTTYRFLICRGCDTATLLEAYTNSDLLPEYVVSYYPERKNLKDREAKVFCHIDQKLEEAYKEIIISFQQDLRVVTAIGIRALLEGICVKKGIDDKRAKNLVDKIKVLKDVLGVSESVIGSLEYLKDLGNDAAHRLDARDRQTLSHAIDLLESLLGHLEELAALEAKAAKMQKIHK